MTDDTITCDCTDDGPCEDHADFLMIREGASLHTADELALLLVADLVECGAALSESDATEFARLEAQLSADTDPHSGCGWFASEDDQTSAYELEDRLTMPENLYVFRDDGYVTPRLHDDCPLLDN